MTHPDPHPAQHLAVAVEPAGPAHEAGLVALFEAAGCPCFCRYWHFEGPTDAWLERCAVARGDNQRELTAELARGGAEARGLVALAPPLAGTGERRLVGWLKVTPSEIMHKAYDRRLYRKLPCFEGDRAGVWTIGCVLVHPEHRRHGVAHALVAAAVRVAPAWGARALESFPRRPAEPVADEELWTGPFGPFAASGFEIVHDLAPYPVMRRELAPGE